MAQEKRPLLTVVTNDIETDLRERPPKKAENTVPSGGGGYHTNPMYEKLLNFKEKQKRKRFTVEDLLKW